MNPRFYVKALLSVAATVLSAVTAALSDDVVTQSEWINVAILAVGACAVFTAPNIPGAKYTKSILAVLTAVLTLVASAVTNGFSLEEIVQIVFAAATALGVYFVPNLLPSNEELADIRQGKHEKVEDTP